jgi:Glycosyl hydrolases family 38 N-terminal domain/Glycosyl hydrolases family 38 C-terminal domain
MEWSCFMKRHAMFVLLCFSSVCFADLETVPLGENGAIPVWLAVGPLPYNPTNNNPDRAIGFYVDFLQGVGGEAKLIPNEGDRLEYEPGKSAVWESTLTDSSGLVNFINALDSTSLEQGVAYAFCELTAEAERECVLKVRSNDGIRLWLNEGMVHDNHASRRVEQEEDTVTIRLKQGNNRLLAKVDQLGGGWGLNVRVLNAGNQAAKGVSVAVRLQSPLMNRFKSIALESSPLIIKTPDGARQLVTAVIVSGGLSEVVCRLSSKGWSRPIEYGLDEVPWGTHRLEFQIPPTEYPVNVELTSSTDRASFSNLRIKPPHPMTIYLVQHVHTDIGYTRPQTEILPDHLRYIDYALDYCDLTDDYPDDAKFRWTCEVSWAVREYLKRRPASQIERLQKRVKEGRLEIAGMFLNMAEIADESSLAASLQPLHTISKEYGFPVKTAMQNDVNGAAWCLVDYFSDIGIEYLSMGINKTRSLVPFDRATCFWWESPSGKRIMASRSDHYHTGNMWGIHTGEFETIKTGIAGYLKFMDDQKYPFDRIAVKYSGYHTDNSPPAMIECDFVREWNEKYASPHLRIATVSEFLDYMKENHGDELAVHRQAWPDWWTDGFGSAARETGASRDTHAGMQITQTLLSLALLMGNESHPSVVERINHVQEQLLFYDEHTYGAAESISDPMAENSMVQWGEKSSYVWEAVKTAGMLREEAWGLLQGLVPRAKTPSIAVFNTLNWPRSGEIEVFIDHEILPLNREYRIIDCEDGSEIPTQKKSSRSEGSYWTLWAKNVPALGYRVYRIETGGVKANDAASHPDQVRQLENRFYSIHIDKETGSIVSIKDKESGKELVDSQCEWNLGQFVYEIITSSGRDLRLGAFQRTTLRSVELHPGSSGPIWKSVVVTGEADGCAVPNGLHCEIRLYETEKRIELHFAIRKNPITSPEAVYVAFPFSLQDGRIAYEGQGGLVRPGENQIPRSSSDWQTMQNFASIRNDDGQIVFVCDRAPLVQFGDINVGKWQEKVIIERPHIYSWVMNNYWFTNFRASQEGEFKWRYALTSTADTGNSLASRFGWGTRVPLVARVVPPMRRGGRTERPFSRSILAIENPNLLFIEAHPSRYGQGIVTCLRELAGKETEWILGQGLKAVQVNVLEEEMGKTFETLSFKPYETKFIKIEHN